MSCSNPIPALDKGFKINDEGRRVRDIKILDMRHKNFSKGLDELKEKYGDDLLLLPCGKCYGCSVDYSRMWSSRIVLESQFHEHNCFITLTYQDAFLPEKPSKRDFQLFIKRLRKEVGKVRYFACGEVGEAKGQRGENGKLNPHYHAVIFGYDFPDKKFLMRSHSGMVIYTSEQLQRLWSFKDKEGNLIPYGLVSIGDVSPESASYVAKYSMKRKLSGEDHGEFVLMSRRPGIGIDGFDETDYITDKLYLYGRKYKMPRYFDKLADNLQSFRYALAKDNRLEIAKNMTSKKFQFNMAREEQALKKMEELRIRKDVLKVRFL